MKNQTEDGWLKNVGPEDLGTGIFLLADRNSSSATKKVLVENITYIECLQRGELAIAFKWVPHNVANYEELIMTCPISKESGSP